MSEIPNTYIGTYADYTESDSTDPSKYTWYRFQGLQAHREHRESQEPMVQMEKHHTCTLNTPMMVVRHSQVIQVKYREHISVSVLITTWVIPTV